MGANKKGINKARKQMNRSKHLWRNEFGNFWVQQSGSFTAGIPRSPLLGYYCKSSSWLCRPRLPSAIYLEINFFHKNGTL